jgi:hypothetical protein
MLIAQAQREIRSAFLGGFVGQLVAGAIWALSAALGTWMAPIYGMLALFFVSMLLYPLTQVILKAIGRPAALSAGNTLGQLATQVAFTVPIGFILVAAATLHHQNWFYPASLIVVGAHYLPFMFLYGMPQFAVLAGSMILAGVGLGLYGPDVFSLGGWVGALFLIGFAFWGRRIVLKEEE